MFILQCECGAEIYCANETIRTAWQCTECGRWYNSMGMECAEPDDADTYEELNCMSIDAM